MASFSWGRGKIYLEIHAPLTSKSKFKLKSDRVKLVAPASPIECLLYLPNVRAIQYKLGPEMLTRLGNSNVLRLPVDYLYKTNLHSRDLFILF